ncbi:MAG: 3-hydroxylacyl-ACP dehydratase [Sulfuricaulis sp.]
MKADRNWIAAHIPHKGNMCLLDEVEHWDDDGIVCRVSSHRAADNPLRTANSLGIIAGIEYAAQAVAVHGALLADGKSMPAIGYLTSVRDVSWQRQRLDDIANDLIIRARHFSGNEATVLYHFSVDADGVELLRGRLSVMHKVVDT